MVGETPAAPGPASITTPILKAAWTPDSPGRSRKAFDRSGAIRKGRTPSRTQAVASTPIASCIDEGASRASADRSERGIARKGMPNALTKQAAASPPVSASMPAATAIIAAMNG